MANSQLIKGEATMRGGAGGSGFVNYAAGMQPVTADRSSIIQAKAEEKQKAEQAINEANSYMDKMKSDFDFTGLDPDTQKEMRNYLVGERSKYAYAANQLAQIDDHTSPEYQYYIDQMNEVQQGFLNLSNQIKAYKDNKVQYGELTKSSQWSLGAGNEISIANSVFGLSDKKARITVLPGGKLGYDLGDGEIKSFDDFEMPTMRAYDTANSIMGLANEYYNKGVPMNDYAASVVSSKIDGMLKSPQQLKSLVSGDFDSDGLSFGDIEWDANNIDGVRQQVKERVMQGVNAAAAEGKAYKDSQKKPTGSRGASNTAPGNRGASNTADTWAPSKNKDIYASMAEFEKSQTGATPGMVGPQPANKPYVFGNGYVAQMINGKWVVSNKDGTSAQSYSSLEEIAKHRGDLF